MWNYSHPLFVLCVILYAYGAGTHVEFEEHLMLLMLEDGEVGLLCLLFLRCLVYVSRFDSVTLALGLFDDVLYEL